MKMKFALIAGMAAITAACGGDKAQTANAVSNEAAPAAQTANIQAGDMQAAGATGAGGGAPMLDAQGKQVATSNVTQQGDEFLVTVSVTDMAPGTYAAHLHMTGRCDAPTFETAGGHWNPTGRQHGSQNPQGQHLGDLPNVTVGDGRHGQIEFRVPNANLQGGNNPLLDADGAAVVIHAGPDDYRTDPSGNSGDRIACGVLGA